MQKEVDKILEAYERGEISERLVQQMVLNFKHTTMNNMTEDKNELRNTVSALLTDILNGTSTCRLLQVMKKYEEGYEVCHATYAFGEDYKFFLSLSEKVCHITGGVPFKGADICIYNPDVSGDHMYLSYHPSNINVNQKVEELVECVLSKEAIGLNEKLENYLKDRASCEEHPNYPGPVSAPWDTVKDALDN